ncbi:MAG: hypothetical protein QXV17_07255 [Candidatus Micrarchaeaceae archaeon]
MGYVPPSSVLKFDSNGNVLANLNAQNITPTVTASNIKFDSNGNVLANLNAQNINPTIANSYTPTLLSHQTGLSVTASTAGTFYAIGSAISVPRNGIAIISMSGHVNGGEGFIQLKLTRGSSSYLYGTYNNASGPSLFASTGNYSAIAYISNTSSQPLFSVGNINSASVYPLGTSPYFLLPVYSSDSLQFYATNNTANDITYVDDVLVMLV